MYLISNQQRDYILRYLELLCATLQGNDTHAYNTRRMAKILTRKLREKRPVDADRLHSLSDRK